MMKRAETSDLEQDSRMGEDILRQAALSERLRAMFEEVLDEPIPDQLSQLVAQIERDEAPR